MLDQIDLERSITKPEYKRRLRELQQRLYDMQQSLFEARRPALIVFEGWLAHDAHLSKKRPNPVRAPRARFAATACARGEGAWGGTARSGNSITP